MKTEGDRFMSFIRRYFRDQESIDDVYQNAWMRIWIKREQLRIEGKFRSWAFQILRSCIYTYIRKKNWGVELFFFDPDALPLTVSTQPSPYRQLACREWQLILNQEIQRMDQQTQEIFSLHFEGELNLREISEVLNLPLNSVKTKFRRSIQKLRKNLEALNISIEELNTL